MEPRDMFLGDLRVLSVQAGVQKANSKIQKVHRFFTMITELTSGPNPHYWLVPLHIRHT